MKKAAVLGKPIAHSLSPLIHSAGYAAVGLSEWSYEAIECSESELAALVAGLGAEWRGLSLTMPLKEISLTVADIVDPVALALGAANTLVPTSGGWRAVNTDAPGMIDALRAAGVVNVDHVAILGGGGTARAALGAVAGVGATATVYARRPEAIDALRPVAESLGVTMAGSAWSLVSDCVEAQIVISTVPRGVADFLAGARWQAETVFFDVVYDPWPTPVCQAVIAGGGRVVSGLDLLVTQAVRQFELYTGVVAPVSAMAQALAASNADAGAMWIK